MGGGVVLCASESFSFVVSGRDAKISKLVQKPCDYNGSRICLDLFARYCLGAEIDKKKKFPSKNDRVEQSFQTKTSMITGGAKAPKQTKVTNMSKSTKTVKRK